MPVGSTAKLPSSENGRHYPGLDGLRAVAVLLVFANHYLPRLMIGSWGWVGLRIFFVLSGFLITGILFDTRGASNRFSAFYARRALRIFPLYYAVLIGGWLLWPVFRWVWHPVWLLWPIYLGNYGRFLWATQPGLNRDVLDHLVSSRHFQQPFLLYYGHFWSLCVEEQFYLLWPPVVFLNGSRAQLMRLSAAVVLLTPVARLLCLHMLSQALLHVGFLERFTPLQCDSLLLGAWLALWLRGPVQNATQVARGLGGLLLAAFALVEVASLSLHHGFYYANSTGHLFGVFGYTAINLAAGCLVLLALDARTLTYRWLNVGVLRWLGGVSYGFYVFHDIPHVAYKWLAEFLVGKEGTASIALTATIALVSTLLLSWASFQFFESRFLRLKSRFVVKRGAA